MDSVVAEAESPAQQLLAKHTAAEAHQPTVEDVVDEEDLAHPSPSVDYAASTQQDTPVPNGQPMSEKAAGKRRAEDSSSNQTINRKSAKQDSNAPLDVQSEEAFPSLAPPPSKPSANASAWGARPASIGKQAVNGFAHSQTSSGTSTPVSKTPAPNFSMSPPAYRPKNTAAHMAIPGRHTESMRLPANQLKTKAQLKKPIPDLLREINKRSKATVEMKGAGDTVIFHGQGPNVESVRRALREVAAEIGAKQSVKVSIPQSVRQHIIGKGGSIIRTITERSGARIQLPRTENTSSSLDDDDGIPIDVEIEGDPIAVAMARREIDAIVNQHTATVNMRMKEVPPEFYPFLAGPNNSRVSSLEEGRDVRVRIPQYHTWLTQPPPQMASENRPVVFQPQEGYHIQITGGKEAAQEIQAELERQVQELRNFLTLRQINIERERHQFIVGERGESLHDFLETTGCSVILPHPSQETETITIVGPPQQIQQALNRVEDLASRMSMTSLDIARQHPNAPLGAQAHARDVTRYLQRRQALQEFERRYNAHIALPNERDNTSAWQIYSEDNRNATRARSDIANLISGHPPARFKQMIVHPYYQRELTQQYAQLVRDQHGVHVLVPDESEESPQVLLVYEGPTASGEYAFPRTQPSSAEVEQFARALQQAEQYIAGLIGDPSDIVQRKVEVPSKYQEKIQKYIAREEQQNASNRHPVQFLSAQDRTPDASSRRLENFPLEFRGPSNAVDQYEQNLLKLIDQAIKDEAERDYTTSCDFPQKFANLLIGKRGENINKIREEFDVDVQIKDGNVEIKGPKAKADAARLHIMNLAKRFEDEITHVLQIEPQYHRSLIGLKGAQIHRLQDRYNVIIQFPRNGPLSADDHSVAAGSGQADSNPGVRGSTIAPKQVTIRGSRRGADEAKDELWSLYQYEKENSHAAIVSVAQAQIPSIIGQGGRELDNLRSTTGAKIDVPNRDSADSSGRVDIKIRGMKPQVEEARKLLQEKVNTFDQSITRSLNVEKQHHQALIGRGGENIRRIVHDAGGSDTRMVQIPRADVSDSTIRVEGNKDVVDKVMTAIEALVNHRENQVTDSVEVPSARHGALIGRGGEIRKGLENEFNVTITIPSTSTTSPSRDTIKVTGLPADVAKAKERIRSMAKEQEGETILIPCRFHHTIADTNGNFFRNLNRDLHVTVDHAGHKKPSRPAGPTPRTNGVASNSLPLITDEVTEPARFDIDRQHSWDVISPGDVTGSQEPDMMIPWVLKGTDAANVAKAKALVEAALADAEQAVTGFLVLPDPRLYRYVIGPGGSTVNGIRQQTGCRIDVPKNGSSRETIEIRGNRDAVEQAKDMMMEAVRSAVGPR